MTRRPELVAHRGANREAEENTLPAFVRALTIGVDGIELDVHLTSDGIPVVHHDPTVTSSSDGRVPIGSVSFSKLRLFSPTTPSLDEVLDLVNGRSRLYVEIKAAAATESVVERLRSRASWCAIHSFDHRVAAHAARLAPEVPVGILLVSYLIDIEAAMRSASAVDVWQQADYVDPSLVDRVHAAGGRVLAWTVNDAVRASELVAIGVDAICTDVPRKLLAVTSRK